MPFRQPGAGRPPLPGAPRDPQGAAGPSRAGPPAGRRPTGASTAPRLPESLDPNDVSAFLADLATHRDRAIVLVMLLGGLRSAEVRGLRLADVDMGLRRLRIVGKGDRERVVPVDPAFFAGLGRPTCARSVRPAAVPGMFRGAARTDHRAAADRSPGLRSLFRGHRASSGATRVRPHRLRHTYVLNRLPPPGWTCSCCGT